MTSVEVVQSMQAVIPADTLCNAHRRNGELCRNKAGFRTPHPGEGRCYLHGGCSPRGMAHPSFKHGQHSAYLSVVSDSVADKLDMLADYDPLDLTNEAQLLRALLLDTLDNKRSGLAPSDIAQVSDMVERISRVVEKATRIRNDTAVTAAEVGLLAVRLADAAEKYVSEEQREDFLSFVFATFAMPKT